MSKNNSSLSFMIRALIIIILLLPVFAAAEYTSTTKKCISCHNDSGFPLDSDGDGVAAPYKRPHNNNTMCESCHGADPHIIKFIQPNGTYAGKSTAASCPACHQASIPNANFTEAFKIPETLRHSSNSSNGSVWGSYWNNSKPKEACIYCHNNTLHNILPLGRILEWSPDYVINGSIGSNFSCAGCHYKGSNNYTTMKSSFTAAGLQTPPEITNGSSWNGITAKYFNHTLQGYRDNDCVPCHGNSLPPGARMSEFLHNVSYADMNNCLGCHSINGPGPEVNFADLGNHTNLTGGYGLTSEDCRTCHFSDPHGGPNLSNTYYCNDCHSTVGGRAPVQFRSSIRFTEKRHGEATCIDCHVADGIYHQGNPRGSVANATYASRDTTNTGTSTRTECGDCHSRSNLDDAPFYAPGGGSHADGSCATGNCHSGGLHIVYYPLPSGWPDEKPGISTPTLDNLTVIQGTDVNVYVTVTFTTYARALVDGAQYRINNSGNTQTIQSWTPMIASDGNFNSTLENAFGRINTNNLSGIYNIEVRGMGGGPSQNSSERYYPMNGDISTVKTAILTVQSQTGFINGTITIGVEALEGALVSTTGAVDTTKPDGTYSLRLTPGNYNVTASKPPAYNDNTTSGIIVTALNTSYANMSLSLKSTGNISGVVTG